MDISRFENVKLLPAAKAYRAFLDAAVQTRGWEVAAAVVTLFIEGTKDDRAAIDAAVAKIDAPPLRDHPLVKHYGLRLEHLALTKAHREVEGDHRASAWSAILGHVPSGRRNAVVAAMQRALSYWLLYRDEVAAACGIARGPDGKPRFAETST